MNQRICGVISGISVLHRSITFLKPSTSDKLPPFLPAKRLRIPLKHIQIVRSPQHVARQKIIRHARLGLFLGRSGGRFRSNAPSVIYCRRPLVPRREWASRIESSGSGLSSTFNVVRLPPCSVRFLVTLSSNSWALGIRPVTSTTIAKAEAFSAGSISATQTSPPGTSFKSSRVNPSRA